MLLAGIVFRGEPIEGNWPATIILCLSFIPIFGLFIPWLLQQQGDKIVVSGKGITRSSQRGANIQMQTFQWSDIALAEWQSIPVGEQEFDTLCLQFSNGYTTNFILSGKVDRNKLRDILEKELPIDACNLK